jgi:hypothetical protein
LSWGEEWWSYTCNSFFCILTFCVLFNKACSIQINYSVFGIHRNCTNGSKELYANIYTPVPFCWTSVKSPTKDGCQENTCWWRAPRTHLGEEHPNSGEPLGGLIDKETERAR